MRAAPAFWTKPPGLGAFLLQPAAAVWDGASRLRRALAHPYRAPVPVICVGNLVAGGAGKTPVVLALADRLAGLGVAAHVVTRGYGGRHPGPLRVDPARHDAASVGDEALLLAERFPCWIARDRARGARAAVDAGAAAVLLDDGFQNPAVDKHLSLLVVDTAYGFGNGRVMPAGPLRESLARGLARANALVLLATQGEGSRHLPIALDDRATTIPAVLTPIAGERFAGMRVLAFAGIGRPEKFFTTLRGLGADLVKTSPFPDHHRFSAAEIARLRRAADDAGASLVTTAKDIVRIAPQMRASITVLAVGIRWPDPTELDRLLAPLLRSSDFDGRGSAQIEG